LIYKTDDQNDTMDVQSEIHWLFDEAKRDRISFLWLILNR